MSYLLGYYGGKISSLGAWITGHLPEHKLYVEPFGGMAGVLLRKRPAPVEVYNDLAGELVNLFRVVREQPEALRELLALTPYARDEYKACRELRHEAGISNVERARRTYVILAQSRCGSLIGKGFSFGGAAYRGSVADTFVRGQSRIPEVCGRLRNVLLENNDWQSICRQHDGPATLLYLDPPYVRHTRTANDGYVFEMTDAQHEELIAWCLTSRSMILLSGYDHALYAPLLVAGWHCERRNVVAQSSAARQKKGGGYRCLSPGMPLDKPCSSSCTRRAPPQFSFTARIILPMSEPITRRTGANGITAGWTEAENGVLRKQYRAGEKQTLLDQLPGRSWNAICLYANGTLKLKRYGWWNPTRMRMLRKHYPTKGGRYVADRLGCPFAKVTKQASLQGLTRVYTPKPTPTPKQLKPVKPTPQPKPKPQPKPVVEAVAQYQPARLTNLKAQKSMQKKKKASGREREVPLAYIKGLPINHPERLQYSLGGERAVLQYRERLQQQAA